MNILPITRSISGVTATKRHGKVADVMIIRTKIVRVRNLMTAWIFSLDKRNTLAQTVSSRTSVVGAVGGGIAVCHTIV